MSVEALRMLERIIVACGGVASIYLGYRLFVVANFTSVSGGTFKSKIFSMTLTKVGPGDFFALFGAYVLASIFYLPNQLQHVCGQTFRSSCRRTAENNAKGLGDCSF